MFLVHYCVYAIMGCVNFEHWIYLFHLNLDIVLLSVNILFCCLSTYCFVIIFCLSLVVFLGPWTFCISVDHVM